MKIKIQSDLYNNQKAFRLIDGIIPIFETGQHEWWISDCDEIINSSWLNPEDAGNRTVKQVNELIQKTFVKNAYSKKQNEYEITEEDIDTYHDLLKFLREPLYIIVENVNSDKFFIQNIAKILQKQIIFEGIQNEWICFDSEGGKGGIPRRIDIRVSKKYKSRIFVFVDSDRDSKESDHKVQSVEDKCIKESIPYAILAKREIENYIPIECLLNEHILNLFAIEYSTLTSEQKDFYDLKEGFKDKGKIPDSQSILFSDLDVKSNKYKLLRNGVKGTGYKQNDLYKLFASSYATKQNIEKRCERNPNELTAILDNILTLL